MKTVSAEAFTPEDLKPLMHETPPGADYPVHALGPLANVVRAIQDMVQAPIAIPAASALCVASLAVQGFANVATLGGLRPVSLYALTIAKSGERKSGCFEPFMKAVRDHEQEQSKVHAEAQKSWRNAKALYDGECGCILAEVKRGKGRTRVAAQADLDALKEPVAPPLPDRIVTEPTFEGLTRLFSEGLPSLGLFSDEGGQFLGGHAMSRDNRQKTLAALNDLWQGNAICRTRGGDGQLTLFGRRLAVHLMAQPGVARTFMTDPMASDMGFLARFLICEPPSTIGTRFYRDMPPESDALSVFSERLRAILSTPMPMDEETRALTPRVLPLSGAAKTVLIGFHDTVERAQAKGGSLAHVTGYASKAAEQAARLAGVLTLWGDLNAADVTVENMAFAVNLAEFYLSEALRITDAAAASTEADQAEKLWVWLLDTWEHDEILPGEVAQRAPIKALRATPAAKSALAFLARDGRLVPLDPETEIRGSNRKVAYRIVRPRHVL